MSACSMSVGWQGYLQLGSGLTLPYTKGSLSNNTEIQKSTPLTVDSSAVNSSIYNYSVGKTLGKGSFNLEVFQSGTYGLAFKTLLGYALRSNGCSVFGSGSGGGVGIIFSPNGAQDITLSKAVIDSFTLNGNPESNVGASFGLTGSKLSAVTPESSQASLQFETATLVDDGNPLPWYSSSFTVLGTPDDGLIAAHLMDWNISVSSQVTPIYTFCDSSSTDSTDFRLGPLTVTGDFSYYNPLGIFSRAPIRGASVTINLQVCTITLPYIVSTNDDEPCDGMNAKVLRKVAFEGLGSNGSASISFK